MSVQSLYEQYIKRLSVEERLQLISLTASDLAASANGVSARLSILDLHGLGADIWQGVDARSYVDALRDEWDQP